VTDCLDIIIITYNRADFLRRTLMQFYKSPFADCRITVIDNASTDSTQEICEEFQQIFPRFHIIRNRINIGGDANFLRAVETARSIYAWVVCDDDSYDFSFAGEILEILNTNVHDVLVAGPVHPDNFKGNGAISAQNLVHSGFWFHFTLSFFPAIIFKTELFDSASLIKGYHMISEHYSNFAFIEQLFRKNKKIFIPKKNMVIRNELGVSVLSPFEWYCSWVNCCQMILDIDTRCQSIKHATEKRGYFKCLIFWISLEKHLDQHNFYRKLFNLWWGLPISRKLSFPIFIPVIILKFPLHWLVGLRNYVYRFLNVPDSQVPPVKVVDRDDLKH